MISEQEQELASLYALDALPNDERAAFESLLRGSEELRQLVHSLQRTADAMGLATPQVAPEAAVRERILDQIRSIVPQKSKTEFASRPGFQFHGANEPEGWKELPLRGAWVKLLSLDRQRGYAVLLGKLEPGVRYPPHTHYGSEDLYILTGHLHLGDRTLGPGDFHHSDPGTSHGVNYSVVGCTLMAVLPVEHGLVQFALGGPLNKL